jgi:hypothetical protein
MGFTKKVKGLYDRLKNKTRKLWDEGHLKLAVVVPIVALIAYKLAMVYGGKKEDIAILKNPKSNPKIIAQSASNVLEDVAKKQDSKAVVPYVDQAKRGKYPLGKGQVILKTDNKYPVGNVDTNKELSQISKAVVPYVDQATKGEVIHNYPLTKGQVTVNTNNNYPLSSLNQGPVDLKLDEINPLSQAIQLDKSLNSTQIEPVDINNFDNSTQNDPNFLNDTPFIDGSELINFYNTSPTDPVYDQTQFKKDESDLLSKTLSEAVGLKKKVQEGVGSKTSLNVIFSGLLTLGLTLFSVIGLTTPSVQSINNVVSNRTSSNVVMGQKPFKKSLNQQGTIQGPSNTAKKGKGKGKDTRKSDIAQSKTKLSTVPSPTNQNAQGTNEKPDNSPPLSVTTKKNKQPKHQQGTVQGPSNPAKKTEEKGIGKLNPAIAASATILSTVSIPINQSAHPVTNKKPDNPGKTSREKGIAKQKPAIVTSATNQSAQQVTIEKPVYKQQNYIVSSNQRGTNQRPPKSLKNTQEKAVGPIEPSSSQIEQSQQKEINKKPDNSTALLVDKKNDFLTKEYPEIIKELEFHERPYPTTLTVYKQPYERSLNQQDKRRRSKSDKNREEKGIGSTELPIVPSSNFTQVEPIVSIPTTENSSIVGKTRKNSTPSDNANRRLKISPNLTQVEPIVSIPTTENSSIVGKTRKNYKPPTGSPTTDLMELANEPRQLLKRNVGSTPKHDEVLERLKKVSNSELKPPVLGSSLTNASSLLSNVKTSVSNMLENIGQIVAPLPKPKETAVKSLAFIKELKIKQEEAKRKSSPLFEQGNFINPYAEVEANLEKEDPPLPLIPPKDMDLYKTLTTVYRDQPENTVSEVEAYKDYLSSFSKQPNKPSLSLDEVFLDEELEPYKQYNESFRNDEASGKTSRGGSFSKRLCRNSGRKSRRRPKLRGQQAALRRTKIRAVRSK